MCHGRRRRTSGAVLALAISFIGLQSSVHSFLIQSPFLSPRIGAHPSVSTTAILGIRGFRAWFESQFPEAIIAVPNKSAQEEFDHVLIDMNALVHISLRRSRSDGHALTMLMKELDACCALATPRLSLVLALDGPPSAAKLATQRRRRFSTFVRSEWKQQQLSRFKKSFSKRDEAKRRRRYAIEIRTLCITPGTAFMDKTERALLYWAWQRMSNPKHPLSKVKVYISSSNVHGEGEVKLLDWILQRNRRGQSIAIVGGDSDLVLEGLVIPPSSTHNVFVLLPDGKKKHFSVSLWETTRALSKFLPKLSAADVMRVRTDMVLLLILNGNDYLPKLRGSSGFNKVFHTYLKLLHRWLDDREAHPQEPFLVDPDTLDFNLPFCVAFFRNLAQLGPPKFFSEEYAQKPMKFSGTTPLQELNSLVASGFVPQPMLWTCMSSDDDDARLMSMNDQGEGATDSVENGNDKENETDEENGDQVLMRLTLGKRGTDDFCEYELWHDIRTKVKSTKHRLARMALDDLTGTEYFSEEEDNGDDEEESYPEISSSGYSWEVQFAAPGRVDMYLAGLLWNLQTYQDGICSDYAYNYGRRMSPTATEIVHFFKDAMRHNRTIGRKELLGDHFSPAVSAGISCLAALPSQAQELIPEPYDCLSNATVEEMYASCMDPEDNCFDLKRFERLCEERIQEVPVGGPKVVDTDDSKQGRHGRRILTGDHFWTVLSKQKVPLTHPFDPPRPFSDWLSELRPNRRIKVSRLMATAEPRPRSAWSTNKTESHDDALDKAEHIVKHESREVKHSDLGNLLKMRDGSDMTILDVEYKRAFPQFQRRRNSERQKNTQLEVTRAIPGENRADHNGERASKKESKKKQKKRLDFDVHARMREFNLVLPPTDPLTNVEGLTPLEILNLLSDAQMIGEVEWNYDLPSRSSYASVDPQWHENVQLIVRKGPKSAKSILAVDLTYEQDRDINHLTRKSLKHHLSSFALCDILGPQARWSEMKFKAIKNFLMNEKAQVRQAKKS